MAGLATLSLRYTILSGFFAILIDSDNLLRFFDFLSISRMAHSIPFGIMAIVVMMFVFGKKDVKLGAICIAAVFAHISFDTISGRVSKFLLFTPFYNEKIVFSGIDWILTLMIAIAIVGISTIFIKRFHPKTDSKKSSFYTN